LDLQGFDALAARLELRLCSALAPGLFHGMFILGPIPLTQLVGAAPLESHPHECQHDHYDNECSQNYQSACIHPDLLRNTARVS
jgi:hypothetical protein